MHSFLTSIMLTEEQFYATSPFNLVLYDAFLL